MVKKIVQAIIQTHSSTPETIKLYERAFGSKVEEMKFKNTESNVDYISIKLEDGRTKNFLLNKVLSWTNQEV